MDPTTEITATATDAGAGGGEKEVEVFDHGQTHLPDQLLRGGGGWRSESQVSSRPVVKPMERTENAYVKTDKSALDDDVVICRESQVSAAQRHHARSQRHTRQARARSSRRGRAACA